MHMEKTVDFIIYLRGMYLAIEYHLLFVNIFEFGWKHNNNNRLVKSSGI